MEGELLRPFDDDVVASRIPADHVMVLRFFEEGVELSKKSGLGLLERLVVEGVIGERLCGGVEGEVVVVQGVERGG